MGSIILSSHIVSYDDYYEPAITKTFVKEDQFLIGHYNFINENDSHFSCIHGIRLDFQYTDPKSQEVITAYTDIEYSYNIVPKTEFELLEELQNKVITIECKPNYSDSDEPQFCLSKVQ